MAKKAAYELRKGPLPEAYELRKTVALFPMGDSCRSHAWEIQNRLAAILNFARQMGKSYVDVESNSFHKQLANFSISDRSMAVCCDVMIKVMRPGIQSLSEALGEKVMKSLHKQAYAVIHSSYTLHLSLQRVYV